MKLHRLVEAVTADQVYRALARAGFEKRGSAFGDTKFVGVDVVDEIPVDLEYVYNAETGSWSFLAARAGEKRVQITSGRGEDDLIRHLERKHRLKASQL